MSGIGRGTGVYIVGTSNGQSVFASDGGNLQVVSSSPKIKNIGRVQVRTYARGGTILPDVPTSYVVIRNKYGNGDIWIGGTDTDAPNIDIGMYIHEDESIILYVQNANAIKMVSTNDYDEVYVICYLDGQDVAITPGNPPPPDLTAPTVVSVFPASAPAVETNTAIYAIFSEELLGASITNANITVAPAPPGGYTVKKDSVDVTKVLIVPNSNLAFSTTYTITLTTGLTDDAEVPNALAAPYPFQLTTKAAPPPPDTTPPTIVSVIPTNNSANVPINQSITVSFSEDLLYSFVTTSTLKLTKVSNSYIVNTTYTHSSDGKTVTILHTDYSLEYSTQYRIDVIGGSSGIKDLASNALAASAQYTFTTAAPSLTEVYNVAGNTYQALESLDYYKVGEYLNTSSSVLKTKILKKLIFYLRKVGNPSGTISFDITNSTGTVRKAIGTYNSASLSTTADTTITFDLSGNTYALAANDMICVSYSNGDQNNYVNVKVSNVDAKDGTNTCMRLYYGFIWTGWSTSTSYDLAGIFYE